MKLSYIYFQKLYQDTRKAPAAALEERLVVYRTQYFLPNFRHVEIAFFENVDLSSFDYQRFPSACVNWKM